ncbi:MAG: hypothetical protein EOP55_04000 [Sphingobacteriales bacterium]|nr:MAG: hypothetical protein EOP55_04000 [Sphingobacteriales bacterium]
MKNQTYLESLQDLIQRTEMLKTFQPENIADIFNVLRTVPQLQTAKTVFLISNFPNEKNWLCVKYNIIDDMVSKIGDFMTN